MYKTISDYGIIGNLHSVALVGLDGSIDWLCLPHIDASSVFAALLDDKKGGRFSVSPADEEWDSTAEYMPNTNILFTRFRTRAGVMQVTDLMPIPIAGEEELEEERHILVSESGIRTAEDLTKLRLHGVNIVLVGEHLMRQPDPGEALRALLTNPAANES